MLYWSACPELFGSDRDPESKNPGSSASPGSFRAHLAHMDTVRLKTQWQLPLWFFWNTLYSSQMVGRLRNQNVLLHFIQQLLYATCSEVSKGETGPKSKHSWSIAVASFMYSFLHWVWNNHPHCSMAYMGIVKSGLFSWPLPEGKWLVSSLEG